MVNISNRILPKSVQNEILEARERKGAFEKNTALRKIAPKPRTRITGEHIETIIYWVMGLTLISYLIWATIKCI